MSISHIRKISKIAVSGNIGVGKSTICNFLHSKLANSDMYPENFEKNTYLAKFYDEMSKIGTQAYNRYAYHVQIEFLKQRIAREKLCAPRSQNKISIIDRCILEDKYIFAENQRRQNIMNENEYLKYEKYFNQHTQDIENIDLLIYLRADVPTLLQRIKNRGRAIEDNLDVVYLEQLNDLYDNHFIPEIKMSSMKIKRENTQKLEGFDLLKQLFVELSNTPNASRKSIVKDRIEKAVTSIRIQFGLQAEQTRQLDPVQLEANLKKYKFLEDLKEIQKLEGVQAIERVNKIQQELLKTFQKGTEVLIYDTNGVDQDFLILDIINDLEKYELNFR